MVRPRQCRKCGYRGNTSSPKSNEKRPRYEPTAAPRYLPAPNISDERSTRKQGEQLFLKGNVFSPVCERKCHAEWTIVRLPFAHVLATENTYTCTHFLEPSRQVRGQAGFPVENGAVRGGSVDRRLQARVRRKRLSVLLARRRRRMGNPHHSGDVRLSQRGVYGGEHDSPVP